VLKNYFTVDIEYPEMLFWRLFCQYILEGRLTRITGALDEFFYSHSILTQYSYSQFVKLSVPLCN